MKEKGVFRTRDSLARCPQLTDQHGILLKPEMSKVARDNFLCGIWHPIPNSNFGMLDSQSLKELTFRSQVGQTSVDEVKKRDLRAELLAAEQEAKNKKRKAEGKPPLAIEVEPADEESNKRRKLIQDAIELDKDDDDDDEEEAQHKDKSESQNDDDNRYILGVSEEALTNVQQRRRFRRRRGRRSRTHA